MAAATETCASGGSDLGGGRVNRWRLKDDAEPWVWIYMLGWIPAALLAQLASGGLTGRSGPTLVCWIVLVVWFAPLMITGAVRFVRALLRCGLPFELVAVDEDHAGECR